MHQANRLLRYLVGCGSAAASPEVGSRLLLGIVVLGLAVLAVGCPAKAYPFRNDDGSWTLQSSARPMERAMKRIRRTANDVCGGRYRLEPPQVVNDVVTARVTCE